MMKVVDDNESGFVLSSCLRKIIGHDVELVLRGTADHLILTVEDVDDRRVIGTGYFVAQQFAKPSSNRWVVDLLDVVCLGFPQTVNLKD